MKGGGSPNTLGSSPPSSPPPCCSTSKGPSQLSFTAIRYHASFTAYAVAAISMRVPVYKELSSHIIDWILQKLLLNPRVFSYSKFYWPDESNPFKNRENVMWLGHVLHVASLYEMLSNSPKYRQRNSIRVTDIDDPKVVHSTDLSELALHVAASMSINVTGGMPCEPGLVFFQCQNHPFCAFTLLEGVGAFPRNFFDPERMRFQKFACEHFRAPVTSGGLKIAVVTTKQNNSRFDEAYDSALLGLNERLRSSQSSSPGTPRGRSPSAFFRMRRNVVPPPSSPSKIIASLPFGHVGSDAWDFSYFYLWSTSPSAVTALYNYCVKPNIDALRESGTWSLSDSRAAQPHPKWDSAPPAVCCFGMNIPKTAWTSAILPVLAQAHDCSNLSAVLSWVRAQLRVESPKGVMLQESCEWSIGNTANYAIATAIMNGSDFRAFHRGELRDSLLPMVTKVLPQEADVFKCRRSGEMGGIDFGVSLPEDWGLDDDDQVQINLEPSPTQIDGGLKLKFGGVNDLDPTFELKFTQGPKSGGLSVFISKAKMKQGSTSGLLGFNHPSSANPKPQQSDSLLFTIVTSVYL